MDALDDLYNVGGSGPSNHLVAGLATATNGDTVTFDLSCRVLVDGREYQGGGLVLADAESSNAFTREYIAATKDPNTTAPWRILEYGGTADGHDVKESVSNSGTVRLEPSRTAANPNGAQAGTALAYLDGGRTLSVTVRGAWNSQGPAVYTGLPVYDENSPFWVNPNQPMVVGQSYPAYLAGNPNGRTAVAIGFFHSLDFGDAKNTYPTAGAMLNTAWTGAEIPAGSTITTAGLTPATLDLKRNGFILGSRVDQDRFAFTTPQPDGTVPTGHLDGTNDDRDASDDEDALDQVVTRPGTNGRVEGFIRGADGIHTFIATPGEIFSLGGQPIPVSTDGTHPATVRGWIDWDHNGTFDPDEASQPAQVSAGATTVNLSWTVPAQATSTPHQAYSYTRLRIARDGDEATAGGLSRTGEVEDYRHRIVVLPRTARPAATVDAKDTNQTTPAASYLEPNADLSGLTFSLKDQAGNPATTVTIDGQGTYTIDPATGEITFDPLPDFVGPATTVAVFGFVDADGDRIYDPDETRTPDGSYTPTVRPELRPATSAGVVTAPQRVGIDELMSPADKAAKDTFDHPRFTLVDPVSAAPATDVTVPGEGRYRIDPATGEITFTPADGFTGTVTKPVGVILFGDADGDGAIGAGEAATRQVTYTPTVYPNPVNVTTRGNQGQPQRVPVGSYFPTPLPAGSTYSLLAPDGSRVTTVTVAGEGRYQIDPATGEIVFTPEPTFTGRTHGVRMVGITADGTVTAPARYEPVVNASATPPAEAPSSMPTITIAPTPGPVPTLPNTGSSIPFGLAGLAAGLLVAGTAILAARRRAA